jgi:hypothetical protein
MVALISHSSVNFETIEPEREQTVSLSESLVNPYPAMSRARPNCSYQLHMESILERGAYVKVSSKKEEKDFKRNFLCLQFVKNNRKCKLTLCQ